jgi:SPP1 family predicted phage head-tail adaptor
MAPRIAMGRMDERVTLQRRVETPDGAGGVTRAWADLAVNPVVWAHVGAKGGREGLNEGRIDATRAVVFTIWNRTDVDETCRILWGGSAFNIRAVLRASSREAKLAIEAERGVAE